MEPPPPPPGRPFFAGRAPHDPGARATERPQRSASPGLHPALSLTRDIIGQAEGSNMREAQQPRSGPWSNAGPIPSKGTDTDLHLPAPSHMQPVGVLKCNLCGKVVKGDRWAMRAHQLTSSRCLYHQGHGLRAREPCAHCGTPLAAGDAWAKHQHERHCRRRPAGRNRPPRPPTPPLTRGAWVVGQTPRPRLTQARGM